MKIAEKKGLIIYCIAITLITLIEHILTIKPEALSLLSHLLVFIKIPLAYMAFVQARALNADKRINKAVVLFGALIAVFAVDFMADILSMLNFYEADLATMKADTLMFVTFYLPELILETLAFFCIITDEDKSIFRIVWLVLGLIIVFFDYSAHMRYYTDSYLVDLASQVQDWFWLLPVRVAMMAYISLKPAKLIKVDENKETVQKTGDDKWY